MPYYYYAWLGSIVSAFFVITAKLTAKHSISNPWFFNFILTFVVLAFMVPIALMNQAGMPTDWPPIIMTAIFSTLFYATWVYATYLLDITTLTPLFNFRGVFTVILSAMFLGEKFLPTQTVFIALIILAGVFSSMDEKLSLKSFFRINILIGIAAALFLAVENVFTKFALMKNDYWTMNLWVGILKTIFVLPTIPMFYKEIRKINLSHILPVGMMGILETASILLATRAYAVNVAVTSLIMNIPFSMIIVFALSFFAPKLLEKHTLKIYAIRFSAAAVMIWSAMQLTK
jgi:drug/metabolite transporter (DMT)-like permease